MVGAVLLCASNLILGFTGGAHFDPVLEFVPYTVSFILLYLIVFRWMPTTRGHIDGTSAPVSGDVNTPSPAPRSSPVMTAPVYAILAMGIAMRIAFLAYPASDDVNRYIWEGMVQIHGHNPYTNAPTTIHDTIGAAPIFDDINHADITTVYPPLAQLVFRGFSTVLYRSDREAVDLLLCFKIVIAIADTMVMLALTPLIRVWNRPYWYLALYAWNPLVLVYGVGEAHIDVVQTLILVVSLLCLAGPKRRVAAAFFLLGCSAMVKYTTAVLLPAYMRRSTIRYLPAFLLPFLAFIPYAAPDMFAGLATFSTEMHYNDLVPRLFRGILIGTSHTGAVLVIFASGVWAICRRTTGGLANSAALLWMWLVCCLPTVHPWYIIPLVVLLIYRPSRGWLWYCAASGAIFWVYAYQRRTGEWIEYQWVWNAMYIPLLLILGYDVFRSRTSRRCSR